MDNVEKEAVSDAGHHNVEEPAEESVEERPAPVSTNVCLSPPSFLIV
jgi:hypothetical protein